MATLDIKLKSYDELTMEITRLNTQLLLAQKTNENLQETNQVLQGELLKLEDAINEYQQMLYIAKKYIKENSMSIGKKYKIIVDENDELENTLTERVEI